MQKLLFGLINVVLDDYYGSKRSFHSSGEFNLLRMCLIIAYHHDNK